ncbi:transglutaminase domain-containing protein [Flavobacterium stagni]|uniref:transglutaminase domain-containing protein n=1 Tax=Flavobacterium stagni TaxID=2506421 RepID=UPI0013E942D8|nr:transglutaminase domain-containing protein [Flavobacterium stagni]
MKPLVLIFFLSLFSFAQNRTDEEIDNLVFQYPNRFSSTEELAQKIKIDFQTEYERARAIYVWVTSHVRYDVKRYLKPKKEKPIRCTTKDECERENQKRKDAIIDRAFRKNLAICSGYSYLYQRIAQQAGLVVNVEVGDARNNKFDIGRRRIAISHAWNTVYVNGNWILLDATWGAGYVDSGEQKFYSKYNSFYFNTKPTLFFNEHYPENGEWMGTPINKRDYLNRVMVPVNEMTQTFYIAEPQTGVIQRKLGEKVKFVIYDLPVFSSLSYSLKKEGEYSYPEVHKIGENCIEFEIIIDRNIGRFLHIFIDDVHLATYKIQMHR